MSTSKRYQKAAEQVDRDEVYTLPEAITFVKEFEPANFDETVELSIALGIDPDQSSVRGSIALPNGLGQERTVLVFAEGDDAREAEEAGADYVGGEELAEKIENEGFVNFDVALAAQYAMPYVGPIGRILGPKGLMPSPKSGTVISEGDFEEAVKEFKAGRIEYRSDDGGNLHIPVGKDHFTTDDLQGNIEFFLDHLMRQRPEGAGGRFLKRCYLSKTMSPSVEFEVEN